MTAKPKVKMPKPPIRSGSEWRFKPPTEGLAALGGTVRHATAKVVIVDYDDGSWSEWPIAQFLREFEPVEEAT